MPVAKAVAGTEPLTTTSALFHPQRNEKMMRSKGSGEMEQLLARCKEMDERGEQ